MTNLNHSDILALRKAVVRGEIKLEDLPTEKFKELLTVLRWSNEKECLIVKQISRIAHRRGEDSKLYD